MANQLTFKNKTFNVGDTIRVYFRFLEEERGKKKDDDKKRKEKTQVFEGIVLSIKGREENKTFTVRKIAAGGVGVERIFPVSSPLLKKIVVKKKGMVRRAKLYYLRKKLGKKAVKLKLKNSKLDQ